MITVYIEIFAIIDSLQISNGDNWKLQVSSIKHILIQP